MSTTSAESSWKDTSRVIGLVAGKLGILERSGVGTPGSGGPGQAKVHGHPVIPWERVVRIGAKVVVHD